MPQRAARCLDQTDAFALTRQIDPIHEPRLGVDLGQQALHLDLRQG